MGKTVKITLIISGVLAVIGLILAIAGFVCGADTSMYVDSYGVHAYSNNLIKDENMSLTAFSSIDIDVDMAKVEILPGSTYGVEVLYHGEGEKITYFNDNGVLRVSGGSGNQKPRFTINLFGVKGNVVKVYVPEKALDSISVKTGLGDIRIDGMKMNKLTCVNNLGAVKIKNITSGSSDLRLDMGALEVNDSRLGNTVIENNMGDFTGKNIVTGSLECNMNMGKVELSGELLGLTTVNSDMGDVKLTLSGVQTDYDFDLITDMGQVYFNGDKKGVSFKSFGGAANSVNVENDMGAVRVAFR